MSPAAIRTTALTKSFGAAPVVEALDLDLPEGIVFGFLGPNGAGKTTTIRLLLGILTPTSGHAQVLGHDCATERTAIARQIGVALDHPGLYLHLTALENLEFFADVFGMDRPVAQARFRELLTEFGLWGRRHERVDGFSRGMRQKLAVARALLHGPRLLFLDEPTNGMDPVAAEEFRKGMVGLAKDRGATVFLTTHDMAEAEEVCDLVGVIKEGRLLTVGDPRTLGAPGNGGRTVEVVGDGFTPPLLRDLRSRPDVGSVVLLGERLTVHLRPGGRTPDIVEALVRGGGRLRGVREGGVSLRQAFLQLMEDSA